MTQGVLQGMACDLQVDTAVCPSGSRPYPIKIATQAPHLHPDMVTFGSKKKKKNKMATNQWVMSQWVLVDKRGDLPS